MLHESYITAVFLENFNLGMFCRILTIIYRKLSRFKRIRRIAQRAIDGLSIIVDYVCRRPP